MTTKKAIQKKKKTIPRPTWEIAHFFPAQGSWSEDDFFEVEGQFPRLELINGRLEILPMPTQSHQFILDFVFPLLKVFVRVHDLGVALFSGMKIRIKNAGNPIFRDPDIVFMKKENAHRRHEKFWEGADLVMEVVSGDAKDRRRDLVVKVKEYAAAGIAEYWIIDPNEGFILVLTLDGTAYKVHGEFRAGQQATSVLLPGFSVSVDDVLGAAKGPE